MKTIRLEVIIKFLITQRVKSLKCLEIENTASLINIMVMEYNHKIQKINQLLSKYKSSLNHSFKVILTL